MTTAIDLMLDVSKNVLALALQLRRARELPGADVLEKRVVSVFERMSQDGRRAGLADDDLMSARFALSAFIDEILVQSEWPGRTQWIQNPLQVQFFRRNTAGTDFFLHLDALYGDSNKRHVLAIYYLCLLLGFRGRYQFDTSGTIAGIVASLRDFVFPEGKDFSEIAPHAERRDRVLRGRAEEKTGFATSLLGPVALVLLVVIFLHIVLRWETNQALRTILSSTGPG